ncbi:hypothetical protein [Limisphaera sp. 4302-co]|uniref:hypothetical protein n=1 Tax=Limisphaera sp. 4302-co TaxID=3400417 RepID=UPI003C19C7DC
MKRVEVCCRGSQWSRAAAFLALGLLASACATGPQASRRAETSTAPPTVRSEEEKERIITGSHIPRKVKRMGQTADTPFPIHILDSRDIELSGAATVAEALRRVPAVR